MRWQRREFLEFLGGGLLISQMPGCFQKKSSGGLASVEANNRDELLVAKGLAWSLVISQGDKLNSQYQFGSSNDFIGVAEIENPNSLLLWVNHEEPVWIEVHGKQIPKKTKADAEKELRACGGSFVRVKRENDKSPWKYISNDPKNGSVHGMTKISLKGFGQNRNVLGTMANCSGGVTPWGTILTCEENFQDFYGDHVWSGPGQSVIDHSDNGYRWSDFFPEDPANYGWVVEVNPKTKKAQKLPALGRFSHENALVVQDKSGRVAVYMGDDRTQKCLYKFVSDSPKQLQTGTLYVANTDKGEWISLEWEDQKNFKEHFKDEWELKVRTRDAAKLVGGTSLNRVEGIARDPITGAIFYSATGDKKRDDPYGSIVKLEEKDGVLGTKFQISTYLAGGEDHGFSSPDNLAFDAKGNLWFCIDISARELKTDLYKNFKGNALYYVPRSGSQAGEPIRVATAPPHAEFTGPCFSPDGSTLFVSVQHPGEYSDSPENPASRWPHGKGLPKSSVVAITGDLLTASGS